MSTGLLFVTAREADYQKVNLVLLHLHDWEYGSGDSFHLVRSRDGVNPVLDHDDPDIASVGPTSPPVPSLTYDGWAGATTQNVETFMLDLKKNQPQQAANDSIYVIVDDKGLEDKTCVLGERQCDDDTDEETDRFHRVRLPWLETYSMFCNLDIANMDFEDYAEKSGTSDEDGWWKFVSVSRGDGLGTEAKGKKREALGRFARQGKIPDGEA